MSIQMITSKNIFYHIYFLSQFILKSGMTETMSVKIKYIGGFVQSAHSSCRITKKKCVQKDHAHNYD